MRKLFFLSDFGFALALWILVFFLAPGNSIRAFGLTLACVAFVAWIVARYQLGHSFAVRAKAKELVKDGLYRWFSHPVYLFGTLTHLGLLIAFQQWWLIPFWLGIPGVLQWSRIERENKVLEEKFGQEFLELRSKNLF